MILTGIMYLTSMYKKFSDGGGGGEEVGLGYNKLKKSSFFSFLVRVNIQI